MAYFFKGLFRFYSGRLYIKLLSIVFIFSENGPESTGRTRLDDGFSVSLSQATVTSILNRLESQGLVKRERSSEDKRRVNVKLTAQGTRLIADAPEPLQHEFVSRFNELKTWEQHHIVAALARVAAMMDAESLDAAPLLATGEEVR